MPKPLAHPEADPDTFHHELAHTNVARKPIEKKQSGLRRCLRSDVDLHAMSSLELLC